MRLEIEGLGRTASKVHCRQVYTRTFYFSLYLILRSSYRFEVKTRRLLLEDAERAISLGDVLLVITLRRQ